jgi:nicotinamidase-related amidase
VSLSSRDALLVIDVQQGLDDPRWGARNNPDAEGRIADLLAAWRATGRPVIHVQHLSLESQSPLREDAPGHAFMVEDATATFERRGHDGTHYSADLMQRVELASLQGEFATVRRAEDILAAVGDQRGLAGIRAEPLG